MSGMALQKRLDGGSRRAARLRHPSFRRRDVAHGRPARGPRVDVDPGRVTGIARVMQYMGSFNELVREELENVRVADRYDRIAGLFDSIVTDARTLVGPTRRRQDRLRREVCRTRG